MKVVLDKILVKETEVKPEIGGGLLLPETDNKDIKFGEVISVGTGKSDEPMDVSVGDVIGFTKFAGTEVKVKAETMIVVSQKDVLIIL